MDRRLTCETKMSLTSEAEWENFSAALDRNQSGIAPVGRAHREVKAISLWESQFN